MFSGKYIVCLIVGVIFLSGGLISLPVVIMSLLQQNILGLQWRELHGTSWSGQADRVSVVARGYRFPVGQLSWQLNLKRSSMLTPCFSIDVESESLQLSGLSCFNYFSKKTTVTDLHIQHMNAAPVAELAGVSIDGEFSGTFNKVVLQPPQSVAVNGNLLWQYAIIHNGEVWLELGDMTLSINTPAPDNISVHWNSKQPYGQLKIDIQTQFKKNALAAVSGYLEPQANPTQSLLDTLDLISRSKQGNQYLVDYTF